MPDRRRDEAPAYPLGSPGAIDRLECGCCGEVFGSYTAWREHASGRYPGIIAAEDDLAFVVWNDAGGGS